MYPTAIPKRMLCSLEFLCCAVPFMLGPAVTVGSGDLPVFTTIEIRCAPLPRSAFSASIGVAGILGISYAVPNASYLALLQL